MECAHVEDDTSYENEESEDFENSSEMGDGIEEEKDMDLVIGIKFCTQEEAIEFYNQHAKKIVLQNLIALDHISAWILEHKEELK
ncbi:hypothetical protein GIB67_041732 [Kingdonia uniflora]|uniref:Uncharacterized protein n=1 Tax=Kingdonia uniflora TaxID=39325 RepID=A0A7J7NPJ2_9MAGN|nr:hypothetical protein GIB67_041732 [Kingdonia uniflora]